MTNMLFRGLLASSPIRRILGLRKHRASHRERSIRPSRKSWLAPFQLSIPTDSFWIKTESHGESVIGFLMCGHQIVTSWILPFNFEQSNAATYVTTGLALKYCRDLSLEKTIYTTSGHAFRWIKSRTTNVADRLAPMGAACKQKLREAVEFFKTAENLQLLKFSKKIFI